MVCQRASRVRRPAFRITQGETRHLPFSINMENESGFGLNRNPVYEYRT